MPLANLGSLVLHHVVFLTHVVYFHVAFSHAEPNIVLILYFACKLLARRAEDAGCDLVAVAAAAPAEGARWSAGDEVTLRGRPAPTVLHRPREQSVAPTS